MPVAVRRAAPSPLPPEPWRGGLQVSPAPGFLSGWKGVSTSRANPSTGFLLRWESPLPESLLNVVTVLLGVLFL